MEEKEFAPTKKKLKKARKEGRVIHSAELALGLLFTAFFCILWLAGPLLYHRLKNLMQFDCLNAQEPVAALFKGVLSVLTPLLIIMVATFCLAYLVHFMQIGFFFSFPKNGKKNFRLFFPFLKIAVLSLVLYLFLQTTKVPHFTTIEQRFDYLFSSLLHLGFSLSLSLLVLGILDYVFQRYRFFKEMRMTKHEMQEEQKED